MTKNKKKIINDPVYGFINIPNEELYDIVQSSVLQRLRRIKQLGLSCLVYPGAEHSRFSHSLGAMHLMVQALDVLIQKGVVITEEEYNGALAAILLHDVGLSVTLALLLADVEQCYARVLHLECRLSVYRAEQSVLSEHFGLSIDI